MWRRIICGCLGVFSLLLTVKGQSDESSELSLHKILPLDTLIKRAIVHSPMLEVKDAQINAKEYDLRASKLEWTRNLAILGSGTYGSGSFLSNINDGSVSAFQLTDRTTLNYALGFSVRISPYDIYGTKRERRKKEYEILSVKREKNVIAQQITNEVIRLYSNLRLAQSLIDVWVDQYQSAELAYQLTKKYFEEGNAPAGDFTVALEKKNGALKELEIAKAEFWKSQKLLEAVVGDSIRE